MNVCFSMASPLCYDRAGQSNREMRRRFSDRVWRSQFMQPGLDRQKTRMSFYFTCSQSAWEWHQRQQFSMT